MNNIICISLILTSIVISQSNDTKIEENIISKVTEKYNISYDWDFMDYAYTFQYDNIIKSGYQLISQCMISDIYTIDEEYFVSIQTGAYPMFYFDLSISEIDRDKLLKIEQFDFFKGLLVVEISEIRKIKFKIDGNPEYTENSIDCSLYLEDSENFMGKGKLIELIME